MYDWTLERMREPAQVTVSWGDWRGEHVQRKTALGIDDFRRTVPGIPHTGIPRNKSAPQTFKYHDDVMAHPFVLGQAGRTVFNYAGGMYYGMVEALEQNESYYIQTTDLEKLQRVWGRMWGYYPNPVLFSVAMPFGYYGVPTPISSHFESKLEELRLGIEDANLQLNTGSLAFYNLTNESQDRILSEIEYMGKFKDMFHYLSNDPLM